MLQSLAKKYAKTPAQILLRWSLQKVADEASTVDSMPVNRVSGFCSFTEVCNAVSHRRKCKHTRLRAHGKGHEFADDE